MFHLFALIHSNTISLIHTWMNDFTYIIQGDRWKRRGGGELFMIWLWLFMMGITICASNNYRMILKASEGTIFPQSSNFNIKRTQQNKQQLRDYNKYLCTSSTWMLHKSNRKPQLSSVTVAYALKHQSQSGGFFPLEGCKNWHSILGA